MLWMFWQRETCLSFRCYHTWKLTHVTELHPFVMLNLGSLVSLKLACYASFLYPLPPFFHLSCTPSSPHSCLYSLCRQHQLLLCKVLKHQLHLLLNKPLRCVWPLHNPTKVDSTASRQNSWGLSKMLILNIAKNLPKEWLDLMGLVVVSKARNLTG